MNKRLKTSWLEPPSQIRQELDHKGWALYSRHHNSIFPMDLKRDEFSSWAIHIDFSERLSKKNLQNISCYKVEYKSPLFDVFKVDIPIKWILQPLLKFCSEPRGGPHTESPFTRKDYGFKRKNIHLRWHLLVLNREIPETFSWLCHCENGITRGYREALDRSIPENICDRIIRDPLVSNFGDENSPQPSIGYISLHGLTSLHVPVLHFCLYYFSLALECDSPILEAVFLSWTWTMRNERGGALAKHMPTPDDIPLYYECKNGLARVITDLTTFKQCYK